MRFIRPFGQRPLLHRRPNGMRLPLRLIVTSLLLAPSLLHSQATAPRPSAATPAGDIPACATNNFSFSTDGEDGSFNGMSHSGTLLVLRNIGPTCLVQPMPQITLLGDNGKDLGARAEIAGARFMHPGPVVLPIVVPAEAEITSTLRWVSGPVYEQSVCLSPKQVLVQLGSLRFTTALEGSVCGDKTKGVTFDATRFHTDPVYTAPATSKPRSR